MYERHYGLIRTLAPLHVGASAGEEAGNLNLIFRDPYTHTGIIPGSSIRGRFRAESDGESCVHWYGSPSDAKRDDIHEGKVKFEHASLVWLPVFCPGQPIVWVSSPLLLRRYASIAAPHLLESIPDAYTGSTGIKGREGEKGVTLFFNLGFMTLERLQDLSAWLPASAQSTDQKTRLVVVADADVGLIHDMALYRQSRVKLDDAEKRVQGKAFFNVEALPEGSVMVFPIAIKPEKTQTQPRSWKPFGESLEGELVFGGLESVGFGRCAVSLHTPSRSHQPAQQEAG
jgi:CRISPR-associated protein Cmr4